MTTETAAVDLNAGATYGTTPVDALARYLTLATFRLSLRLPGLLADWEATELRRTGPERDAYVNACNLISAQYGLIAFLRREVGPRPEGDDPIIEQVYQPYDGLFEYVDSDLTAWLTEYGVDPETVIQGARADREAGR